MRMACSSSSARCPPCQGAEFGNAHDLLVPQTGLILHIDLREINDELRKYLSDHPGQGFTPQKYGELVAALFRAKG